MISNRPTAGAQRPGLTRRRFVTSAGGAAMLLMLDAASPAKAARAAARYFAFANAPVRTVRVVRAADQLDTLVELFDVTLAADQITPAGAQPAIRVTFGSQHTAEDMFDQPVVVVPTAPIDSISAGVSQVVIPVTGAVAFTLDQIIALAETALTVQTDSSAPDGDATVLEVPAGLAISPVAGTTMTASATPFTVGNTTEVWVAKFQGPGGSRPQMHAVHNLSTGPDLITRIPTATDRDRLVTNTIAGTPPVPFEARTLWLSSSGAFARFDGDWPAATLTKYRHRINTGRDVHVEVQTVGYLAPFGHRAAVTSIADRIFTTDTAGVQTSIVRLERFLSILDPTIDVAGRAHQRDGGRGNPFVSVVATTDETQQIVEVQVIGTNGNPITGVSDIKENGTNVDLIIDFVATDRDGHLVSFSLPATFIAKDAAHQTGTGSSSARLVNTWNSAGRLSRREVQLRGQVVAFADPLAPGLDQTSKPTYLYRASLQDSQGTQSQLAAGGWPGFNPAMGKASVTDDFIGTINGSPSEAFEVDHHQRWLQFGNDGGDAANFDQSYLVLTEKQTGRIGGDLPTASVAAVDVSAEVFNQTAGIGPDLPSISTPWDPADALGETSKILGSILLNTLIDLVDMSTAVPGVDIPNTEITTDGDTITIVYSFKPKLKSNELVGFAANANTRCCVVITTTTSISGATPTSVVTEMTVSDFTMVYPPGNVVEIVEIDYEQLVARVASDGTLTIDPRMSGWRLGQDLSFLQPVFDSLSKLGSLKVDLGSDYISFEAGVTLPTLNMGMMAISNFGMFFGMDLPLQGQPLELHAGVGTAASPVEVKIYIFGGGFYVNCDLAFHDSLVDWTIRAGVNAFVEIGGDFVVVEASLRLQVQMSFTFVKSDGDVTTKFKGSVSLEGVIGLLGIVEVSASLVGTLTYNFNTEVGKAKGTIHWSVETFLGGPDGTIPLGSIDFVLGDGGAGAAALASADRAADRDGRLAASAVDAASVGATPAAGTPRPSFGDFYSSADWSAYSSAFA